MGNAMMSGSKMFLLATVCAIFLCLTLVNIMEKWTFYPWTLPRISLVQEVNDFNVVDNTIQDKKDLEHLWEKEYQSRIQRVRDICKREKAAFNAKNINWRVMSNRLYGKQVPCGPTTCPIIVDEKKDFLYCFISKVASTQTKGYILNISNIPLKKGAIHSTANKLFTRISPVYNSSKKLKRFLKIIFVRHPFDRLVSAFRDKTKKSNKLYYNRYWNALMERLRSRDAPHYMLTFEEFVWNIIHTSKFDRHWAPYWSRCNPCQVDYDFIGKLETAKHDYTYAFKKLGIALTGDEWWERAENTPRSISLSYFSTVSDEDIQKLYEIYRMDFELFGYSVEEFVRPNT